VSLLLVQVLYAGGTEVVKIPKAVLREIRRKGYSKGQLREIAKMRKAILASRRPKP